jgi:parallel beta-helix repeat protein
MALLLATNPLPAAVYYVSGSGKDSNNGLATNAAFRTLATGVSGLNPGDTLMVMNGTYTNDDYTSAVPSNHIAFIKRSGTSTAWITIQNYPGATPQLVFNGYGGFGTATNSYLIIKGFTITGNNDHCTLSNALAQTGPFPFYSGNGIGVGNNYLNNHPHHICIISNTISKCGGCGITAIQSDYVTIEGNRIFSNAWYSPNEASGISMFQDLDSDTNTGYKMVIRGNLLYGNKCLVPQLHQSTPTDGNGIIIDRNQDYAYGGRTLVVNNISVCNGGSGIHTFHSSHVDLVNNTSWHNCQVLTNSGEIFASLSSSDVNLLNNICVAASGNPVNHTNVGNTGVAYDYNVYFGGKTPEIVGLHDLLTDPLLTNPQSDPTTGDFRVQLTSPAIDSGTNSPVTPTNDFRGLARPVGAGPDRGAYEAAAVTKFQLTTTNSAGQVYPELLCTRWQDPSGSRYSVELSNDLLTWTNASGQLVTLSTNHPDAATELLTLRELSPLNAFPRRFYRIRYVQ